MGYTRGPYGEYSLQGCVSFIHSTNTFSVPELKHFAGRGNPFITHQLCARKDCTQGRCPLGDPSGGETCGFSQSLLCIRLEPFNLQGHVELVWREMRGWSRGRCPTPDGSPRQCDSLQKKTQCVGRTEKRKNNKVIKDRAWSVEDKVRPETGAQALAARPNYLCFILRTWEPWESLEQGRDSLTVCQAWVQVSCI